MNRPESGCEKELAMLGRRKAIVDLLNEKGSVTVAELSQTLNVTLTTIRRDLAQLEKQGVLMRIYGGAVLEPEPFASLPLSAKERLNFEAKERIARQAAKMINPGETIILDEGSTCIALARELRKLRDITVVTNGLKVAYELTPNPHIVTILVGGICGHNSFVAYGHDTIEGFSRIRAHKYFMGIDAIQLGFGISDGDPNQVPLKVAKIAVSKEVIGMADRSKFSKIAVAKVGRLGILNHLIMDSPVNESLKLELEKERVNLIEVD